MRVNLQSTFPLTHEHTLWILHNYGWTSEEKKTLFNEHSLESLYVPVGNEIRRCWGLGDVSYPLPRHYMRRFNVGSPNDMVCLILQHFLCQIKQQEFNIALFVSEIHQNWRSRGKDPVTMKELPKRV